MIETILPAAWTLSILLIAFPLWFSVLSVNSVSKEGLMKTPSGFFNTESSEHTETLDAKGQGMGGVVRRGFRKGTANHAKGANACIPFRVFGVVRGSLPRLRTGSLEPQRKGG